MIQSMTGFGRDEHIGEIKAVTVEIKSVNHRYNEIQVKMPRKYTYLEERVRRYVSAALSRGKVDVFVKVEERADSDKAMNIDKQMAVKYHYKIRELAEELNIPMDLGVTALIQMPGVLALDEADEEMEAVWTEIQPAVDGAVNQLLAMRKIEGEKLSSDFKERLIYLETLRQQLLERSPAVVVNYRERLRARIKELLEAETVDENRIAVETALFADRASINEELVRLDSHIHQFRSMLKEKQAVGRKLDFLCQEMNREVNTTGSKANDLEITHIVVEMKSELEKLREQVQNVE